MATETDDRLFDLIVECRFLFEHEVYAQGQVIEVAFEQRGYARTVEQPGCVFLGDDDMPAPPAFDRGGNPFLDFA